MPLSEPGALSAGSAVSATRSLERSLALLVAVSELPGGATLTDLAKTASLSTSTASRLLGTLAAQRFVYRGASGRFRAGPRLAQIGAAALRDEPLYELAGPHLAAIAETTGETANLAIAVDGGRILYLRQHASHQFVRTASWAGRTIPREGTALAAALDGELTEGGYASATSAVEPDVTAVAAPIYGGGGQAVAAISVLAPTYRTSGADVAAYGREIVAHARELSATLASAEGLDERPSWQASRSRSLRQASG